jgi:hypothetical protein
MPTFASIIEPQRRHYQPETRFVAWNGHNDYVDADESLPALLLRLASLAAGVPDDEREDVAVFKGGELVAAVVAGRVVRLGDGERVRVGRPAG